MYLLFERMQLWLFPLIEKIINNIYYFSRKFRQSSFKATTGSFQFIKWSKWSIFPIDLIQKQSYLFYWIKFFVYIWASGWGYQKLFFTGLNFSYIYERLDGGTKKSLIINDPSPVSAVYLPLPVHNNYIHYIILKLRSRTINILILF